VSVIERPTSGLAETIVAYGAEPSPALKSPVTSVGDEPAVAAIRRRSSAADFARTVGENASK
jgi:hypothetical protein